MFFATPEIFSKLVNITGIFHSIQSSRAFRSITCIIMQYNVENVISMRNVLKHKRKIFLNILSFATFILFGKKSEEETTVKQR